MSTVISPTTFAFRPLACDHRACRTKKTAPKRQEPETPKQSPSSIAAIERQKALMLQDTEVMYTFGRNSIPVLMSIPLFRLGWQPSAKARGKRRYQDILRQTDEIFQQSQRDMTRRSKALTALQEQLRVSLREKRLETFQADFAVSNRFVLTDNAAAECSVCFDKKPCYPITCCATEASKNYWCHDCFVEHAFESSEMGTKLVAACPLCREKFDVYRHLDRDGGAEVEQQMNAAKRPKR